MIDAILTTEHHASEYVADRQGDRDVAHDLACRPVGIGHTVVVDALNGEKADVCCKNDRRLSFVAISTAISGALDHGGRTHCSNRRRPIVLKVPHELPPEIVVDQLVDKNPVDPL